MNDILEYALISRDWPVWIRYVITCLAVVAAYFLHWSIFGNNTEYPILLFYPVIIATGLFLDRGNGIFASVLSTLLAVYYLLPIGPVTSYQSSLEIISVLLFLATGLTMAIFVEALHKLFVSLHKANQQISHLAEARGILLRELSHRTRNDLAALNSLFLIQAHSLRDPGAQRAFKSAAERMQIIARVHERLTIDAHAIVIDSERFITDLSDDLRLSVFSGRPVALELAVESHKINHQSAVAVGLIINELITNALKYAFPDGRIGKVIVSFRQGEDIFRLRVSDNGVGFQNLEHKNGSGLGLELIRTLAAQLDGNLVRHDSKVGTDFEISFPNRPERNF
jgi:two-component sensor histidine kinase